MYTQLENYYLRWELSIAAWHCACFSIVEWLIFNCSEFFYLFDIYTWSSSSYHSHQSGPVIDMPVPSSYNDVTQDKHLRDFVGWAWYERNFYMSHDWTPRRTVLRFDSAHYFTKVVRAIYRFTWQFVKIQQL